MMEYSVPREEYNQLKDALEDVVMLAEEGSTFFSPHILRKYMGSIIDRANKGLQPFGKSESHDNMGWKGL